MCIYTSPIDSRPHIRAGDICEMNACYHSQVQLRASGSTYCLIIINLTYIAQVQGCLKQTPELLLSSAPSDPVIMASVPPLSSSNVAFAMDFFTVRHTLNCTTTKFLTLAHAELTVFVCPLLLISNVTPPNGSRVPVNLSIRLRHYDGS
jgi:hypothetical protein